MLPWMCPKQLIQGLYGAALLQHYSIYWTDLQFAFVDLMQIIVLPLIQTTLPPVV